jgi:hypothetical protein
VKHTSIASIVLFCLLHGITFGCIVVSHAAPIAVQTSTTQMQLIKSAHFLNRVLYLSLDQAFVVLAESHTAAGTSVTGTTLPASAACHNLRFTLAQGVIASPTVGTINRIAVAVIRANISGAVILGTVVDINSDPPAAPTATTPPDNIDTSVTDSALATAIADFWSSVAGCDQGS